jgi:broad specificity phosphatase PhoE
MAAGWTPAASQTASPAPTGNVSLPEPQAVAPQSFGYAAGPVHNPVPLLGGGKTVREALQKGGYIIYVRHGRTDLDQISRESGNRAEGKIDLARCATQRNLSEEGRAELKLAGDQFRKAAIPIDKTLASPYCRTKETAAYFTPKVQVLPLLASFSAEPPRAGALEQLFSQKPATGKNTLIVAHGLTLRGLTGFAIGEGHALVMEPGNFKTIVARIAPQEWAGVASVR